MKLAHLVATCALALATAVPSFAQTSSAKEQAIRQIMEMTDVASLGRQINRMMMDQLRPMVPDVPDTVWTELTQALDSTDMVSLMIPIYDRHFTLAELEGLVAFYATPLGRALIQKTPAITQESMVAGQQWGREKALAILQKLEQRGYQPSVLRR